MRVITDYTTPIHRDMCIRQLRRLADGNVSLDGWAGKPQNRFGWLPVYVILGPSWQSVPIQDHIDGIRPSPGHSEISPERRVPQHLLTDRRLPPWH